VTAAFIAVMQREVASIRGGASEPEDDLDQEDRDYLVERWERKIHWCNDGEMRWAHFRAVFASQETVEHVRNSIASSQE
jgi:hypothetical protein